MRVMRFRCSGCGLEMMLRERPDRCFSCGSTDVVREGWRLKAKRSTDSQKKMECEQE